MATLSFILSKLQLSVIIIFEKLRLQNINLISISTLGVLEVHWALYAQYLRCTNILVGTHGICFSLLEPAIIFFQDQCCISALILFKIFLFYFVFSIFNITLAFIFPHFVTFSLCKYDFKSF